MFCVLIDSTVLDALCNNWWSPKDSVIARNDCYTFLHVVALYRLELSAALDPENPLC